MTASAMPKKAEAPPIPDEVCVAAIETLLKPLGTSLRHYMPLSKADAIEAMRGVLMAERERAREAAAVKCEDEAKAFLSPHYASNQPLGSMLERFACEQCAAAIRGERQ